MGSRGGGCEDPSGHQGFERSHITESKQRDLGRRFTDFRLTGILSQNLESHSSEMLFLQLLQLSVRWWEVTVEV